MQKLKEKQKKRLTRQQIRWVTPFIGILSILLITKLGISVLGFEKYGWEPRDTFVLLLLPAMLFFGNIYCGWFCFGGWMQKVIYKIGTKILGKERQKRFEVSPKIHSKLKYVRYVILVAWIITIILSMMGVVDSSIAKYIKTTLIATLSMISLPLGLFTERFLCRYFCINGAMYGLANKIGFKRIIRKSSTCVSCKKCDRVCPMGVEVSTQDKVRDLHCINCYKCVDGCPVDNTLEIL